MSDNYTEPQDDDGDEDFKNLRAKAKKADQYERENAQLTRRLAFVEAGIPTTDPRMQYFVKGYDGELDAESIRSAAIEAGFLQPSPQQVDPQVQQAQQGQQRVMDASSGVAPTEDLDGIAYGMQQALNEGGLEGMAEFAKQYGVTFDNPTL